LTLRCLGLLLLLPLALLEAFVHAGMTHELSSSSKTASAAGMPARKTVVRLSSDRWSVRFGRPADSDL
jgi:hypothetical protein